MVNTYFRNKLIFTGTPETLTALVAKLETTDKDPINFNKIIPLNDDHSDMEEKWGISADPEELDWVLYHNQTILEYSFDTEGAIPLPIFKKLAETYPEYAMKVNYASDDYGEDCGIYESPEGSSELEAKEPDDPFVFGCEIWDRDPDEEMQERMINAYEE